MGQKCGRECILDICLVKITKRSIAFLHCCKSKHRKIAVSLVVPIWKKSEICKLTLLKNEVGVYLPDNHASEMSGCLDNCKHALKITTKSWGTLVTNKWAIAVTTMNWRTVSHFKAPPLHTLNPPYHLKKQPNMKYCNSRPCHCRSLTSESPVCNNSWLNNMSQQDLGHELPQAAASQYFEF